MKCKRCLNEDPEWFYLGSKGWYCRKCISFGRILIEEDLEAEHALEIQDSAEEYTLKYPLTKQQVKIAAEVIKNIKTKDVLVKAVCGFRVIIVTVANSLGNIRVFELLPKLKTKKYGWCIA